MDKAMTDYQLGLRDGRNEAESRVEKLTARVAELEMLARRMYTWIGRTPKGEHEQAHYDKVVGQYYSKVTENPDKLTDKDGRFRPIPVTE